MSDQAPESTTIAVALPVPLRTLFDYLPPEGLEVESCPIGSRLEVPFGHRQLIGTILAHRTPAGKGSKLRRAQRLLDPQPVLPPEVIELVEWAAGYYHHPIGEVASAALPTALRRGEPLAAVEHRYWQRVVDDTIPLPPRSAHRQHELLEKLSSGVLYDQQLDSSSRRTLAALERRGLVESLTGDRPPWNAPDAQPSHQPNQEQQIAIEEVSATFGSFACHLLEGITGSGKTEVYLQLIERQIADGRQVLVLLPEIGLTPQWVRRFEQRLQRPVALLHSSLADQQRLSAWEEARAGQREVVIGTRSALFTPLPRLGLLIVDEEHDGAFKQQDGFRYSARDLAVVRARLANCPVVLGSATPSLETLHNSRTGRYHHLTLRQRAGRAKPPRIELIDCRERRLDGGLSTPLLERIERHLVKKGQVLLFLNRRGYAPTMICRKCGWIARCNRCDVNLTWHQERQRLSCHHCGCERQRPQLCEACGDQLLSLLGVGIEQVEESLNHHFPDIPAARIDRDSTRRKGSLNKLLGEARRGEQRLLLGTQMLAKGHHLPEVTLVAIINADGGLFAADFRAAERMAQLVIQVAGRAGRAERPGEVLIQTSHPDHPLLQSLIHHGYPAFARDALDERLSASLPPFNHLALLRCEGRARDLLHSYLVQIRQMVEARRDASDDTAAATLLGPVAAPIERRADRYRAQLLIESKSRPPLHQLVELLIETVSANPPPGKMRWSIDIDPIDLG